MKKLFKLSLVVVMVALVGFFLVGCNKDNKKEENMTRVTVDINPSIEIIVDEDDKVVSVTALNDEGNIIIVGETIVGKTVEEALEDYEKTLLPNATSFGQTVHVDGKYVGDVWCYCIDMDDEPNCMLSFCIFELEYWSKGIATSAVNMFIKNVCERYDVKTIGAFTFAHNNASIRVLEKNGFVVIEEFEEDGVLSKYLQYEC